eukprot:TRINITY_DN5856_c0_g1_i5.p2 TRINITY_DN5856_c0_g1~~TRINITY_DN5856_c0_g1_i5.p2  ORF type:complete len:256 (-),score=27.46 TRINITY_DN5856_c0_g1_i5:1201-1968(-)
MCIRDRYMGLPTRRRTSLIPDSMKKVSEAEKTRYGRRLMFFDRKKDEEIQTLIDENQALIADMDPETAMEYGIKLGASKSWEESESMIDSAALAMLHPELKNAKGTRQSALVSRDTSRHSFRFIQNSQTVSLYTLEIVKLLMAFCENIIQVVFIQHPYLTATCIQEQLYHLNNIHSILKGLYVQHHLNKKGIEKSILQSGLPPGNSTISTPFLVFFSGKNFQKSSTPPGISMTAPTNGKHMRATKICDLKQGTAN